MDQPGEFFSDPFDFRAGGVVSIEASVSAPRGPGVIGYSLEGSEDRTCWTEVLAGSVSDGQRVEVPCRPQRARWGRVRLRSFGGDARVNVRWFGEGKR